MQFINEDFILSASDLVNFSGCSHLTELDREVALGHREKPVYRDPNLELLKEKGIRHEQAYIEYLRSNGKNIKECYGLSLVRSLQAMQSGEEVITQAYLKRGNWIGFADILIKVPGESKLGNYHYEVQDTKLASETKGATLLQLCLYNDLLSELQGIPGKYIHAVKPGIDFPTDSYRYAEFEAYYNFLLERFEKVMQTGPHSSYPLPVDKCNICRWWKECNDQWIKDDHPSLIAGAGSRQVKELNLAGYNTLQSYAESEGPIKPNRGSVETYRKLLGQAKIQLEGRKKGRVLYELLPFEEQTGLHRLPAPSEGDVFFDIEGDRYFEGEGIEYLFGWAYLVKGELIYMGKWAENRLQEKQAFEEFMNFLMNQWKKYPDFHIYHYAPYEPSAIKQLSVKYNSFIEERDRLLRSQRFIDLLTITKQALQASVTSYSLKEIEKLCGFVREADLREASSGRRLLTRAFDEGWINEIPLEIKHLVERYNRDDVIATERLRHFLENRFLENELNLTRPELKDDQGSEDMATVKAENRELWRKLTQELPEKQEEWENHHHIKWLCANLIEYYWREKIAKLWEVFSLRDKEAEAIYDERNAIAGLTFKDRQQEGTKLPVDIYSYPDQEISEKMRNGSSLVFPNGNAFGRVDFIDFNNNLLGIKKRGDTKDVHTEVVILHDHISTRKQESALRELIIQIAENDHQRNNAAWDLLARSSPRLRDGKEFSELAGGSETAAIDAISHLDNSILPIQGPPGTGKTYLGGALIAKLVSQGKRVGVTAVSHKVIENLLQKSVSRGKDLNVDVRIKHCVSNSTEIEEEDSISIKQDDLEICLGNGYVIGATTFVWSDEPFRNTLDYLFVDEAGQISMANVLAISRCAKNIIFLGDPQQLQQPQQAAHPFGSDVSALEYLLEGRKTISGDKGIFLSQTWRLNSRLNKFNSILYYEARLDSHPTTELQELNGETKFKGQGFYYLPVDHEGNQSRSEEEVDVIMDLVKELLNGTVRWTDRNGIESRLASKDILIVAPYNSQVFAVREKLNKNDCEKIRVGTVDKFQGQEAPIVIYSMTSSSVQDAPRGMSFLFDPHRLNVATSRAQCVCIIIGSPALFEAECKSVEQMRMANGICYINQVV